MDDPFKLLKPFRLSLAEVGRIPGGPEIQLDGVSP